MNIATNSSNDLAGLDEPRVWSTQLAFEHLSALGLADNKRAAERKIADFGLLPPALDAAQLRDELERPPTPSVIEFELEQARSARLLPLFAQTGALPSGRPCLFANDARGARYWVPMSGAAKNDGSSTGALQAIDALQGHLAKEIVVFPHGELAGICRDLPDTAQVRIGMLGYQPVLDLSLIDSVQGSDQALAPRVMTHLDKLESEAIYILREAVAEAENPVMMYSVGKDSSVMLHLARKAFYPSPPPFPLLHVDTRWKFRQMYLFRDMMAQQSGMKLIVHINPDAIAKNINPFDHGSALHTDITKTEGLKQALAEHKFDMVFGGARRDEEKSRAKERVFSFRSETQRWDPKNQRPELWNLYNARKNPGESIRVFPISNWTELDIWQYIYREQIPIVPLYFAKERPIVERDGMIMMVDDERLELQPGEKIQRKSVRFRTLGCYPLTGGVESSASNLAEVVLETLNARTSERQGRAIDKDSSGSMEKKKQEGYF